MRPVLLCCAALCLVGCGGAPAGGLHVAAAANLQRVMEPLSRAFQNKSGARIISSFGASTQLAQQIENGAPFDVFLSADTAQVDRLVSKGWAAERSRAVYARGVLVLWAPKNDSIRKLEDLRRENVKKVGVANPELAPYGKAAIETLTALHLWPELERKVVYGPNISVVAQFAESGNADASFTALALVVDRMGNRVDVPEELHQPIEQAMCVMKGSESGMRFREFLLGTEGQSILGKFGYLKR